MTTTMNRRRFIKLAAIVSSMALSYGATSFAQAPQSSYPAHPIQIVVPFSPGGPTDFLGRFLAKSLSEQLGQPVVVVNRPGAGGNIGTESVAQASADGYTLLVVASSHAINPAIYPSLTFDPVEDFTPISLLAAGPFVLTVRPSLSVSSVERLITLARKEPGKLNYASAGTGTANHLAGELFKQMADIDILHVPFNGAAPASQAILSGVTDILFNNMVSGLPMIKAGKVKALAVTGPQRSPALPDVPTISESGMPGFDVQTWYGLLAPAGLNSTTMKMLNTSARRAFSSQEALHSLEKLGLEGSSMTSGQFGVFLGEETKKWAKIAERSKAKAD